MASWGNFFGKVAEQFQGRIERLKNEKARLEKRKLEIKKLSCSDALATEGSKVQKRLDEINIILETKASD
jgi:hypothetical protein